MPHDTKFTTLAENKLRRTLAQRLVRVADRLRDLHTRFGGRPYRVRIVRTRWVAGGRGLGANEVVFEREILPTPLVEDLSTLTEVLQPVGLEEVGSIRVSEISGRFREEELLGFDDQGNPPSPDENVFWEVEFVDAAGSFAKRRFVARSAPSYSPYRFQWTITLEKAEANRTKVGDVF